jgi:hypothetical protein
MSGVQFNAPRFVPVSSTGRPYPASKLYFYAAGTTTLATVYTNSALTIPAPNPMTANSAGMFATVFLSPTMGNYKAVLQNSTGAQLWSEDNIPSTNLTAEGVGAALYYRTNEEISAAITPTYYQYPPGDVCRYGADTSGSNSSKTAIESAIAVMAVNNGCVYFPEGTYVWAGAITVAPDVSLRGEGVGSNLRPESDGFIFTAGSSTGGKRIENLYLTCTADDSTGCVGLDFCPQTTYGSFLWGITVRDVCVSSFETAMNVKDVRDSYFEHCYTVSCKYGARVIGLVVSTTFNACKFVRGGDPSLDSSIGMLIEGYTYDDAVARSPEAIRLTGETLCFGFNTNLDVVKVLNFSASSCGFDYAAEYGIKLGTLNGGVVIENCWIAASNDVGENAKGITVSDVGSAGQTLVRIVGNFIAGYGTPAVTTDSWGIYLGDGREGVIVEDNQVAPGVGIGIYINGELSRAHTIAKNNIGLVELYSLWQVSGGGHFIRQNRFDMPIARTTLGNEWDTFDRNHGTAVTCFHGLVTVPAGAGPATYDMVTDLGLYADPVTGSPGNLRLKVHAQQVQGSATRGAVRAYQSSDDIILSWSTAVGLDSADTWIDMEPY